MMLYSPQIVRVDVVVVVVADVVAVVAGVLGILGILGVCMSGVSYAECVYGRRWSSFQQMQFITYDLICMHGIFNKNI